MLSVELTVMRSSLVLTLTLLRFQDTVGSGWPRGGTHSNTAGSPAATTTSLGACRKSSLRTRRRKKRNLISVRSPVCLVYFKQRLEIKWTDHWVAAQMTILIKRNLSWILFCFLESIMCSCSVLDENKWIIVFACAWLLKSLATSLDCPLF